MLLRPSELSLVEALLSGDVEIEGELERIIPFGDAIAQRLRSPSVLVSLVRHLTALPRDGGADGAARVRARRAGRSVQRVAGEHEPERDRAAIRYHYDVGNDFYRLWLDERMVYSCAYFDRPLDLDDPTQLEQAQRAKLDLICRKLRLVPGERLLEVGCGWGGLIIHAAQHYGVDAVGITLSEKQASEARRRIAEAGLAERCRVEVRDYRHLAPGERYPKIASVGMVEHVGVQNLATYFGALVAALEPGGLLLNHGIVGVQAAREPTALEWIEARVWKRDTFIDQYVFPDGKLGPLHAVIEAAEQRGLETRDVESRREHYAMTLRHWLHRLTQHADEAIALTDERTYRTWRLYMTGSAYGFASGTIGVVQALFSRSRAGGESGLPLRRDHMLG